MFSPWLFWCNMVIGQEFQAFMAHIFVPTNPLVKALLFFIS
jgi:hypothetical protein